MELTVLKTAVDQLTVWGENGERVVLQPNGFSWNDVTHENVKWEDTPSIMTGESFKWQKQKKITTFTNKKKKLQIHMSEL